MWSHVGAFGCVRTRDDLVRRAPSGGAGRNGWLLAAGLSRPNSCYLTVGVFWVFASFVVAVIRPRLADVAIPVAQRAVACALAHHMLAGFQGLDSERGVLVEAVGEDHRVDVVLEETVVIGVGRHTVTLARFAQAILLRVAQCHQFHARQVGGPIRKRLPPAHADHANPDGLCCPFLLSCHKLPFATSVERLGSRVSERSEDILWNPWLGFGF